MIDIKKLIRPNILALTPYTSAREAYTGTEGTFLDANECPYGALNRYPDPYQKALKNELSILTGLKPENMCIGNGSDEIIDLTFRIFCNPNQDRAITFTPTYGMYRVSAALNDVELLEVPLTNQFQIDMGKLAPFFKDPTLKLMFICSPNNPTGNLIRRTDLEYILNHFKGIVLLDEAYINFADEASMIQLIDQYPQLIISQTFSKAWAQAAIRIGMAYANEAIIQFYNKAKPPYNVSMLNQQAAIEALKDSTQFKHQLTIIRSERKKLANELTRMTFVKIVYPSDTNFLLIEVEDANRLYAYLIRQKIIVRNRHHLIDNCLRITVGTPAENNLLITTLKSFK